MMVPFCRRMYEWDSVVPAIFVDLQYDLRCFSSVGTRELIHMWTLEALNLVGAPDGILLVQLLSFECPEDFELSGLDVCTSSEERVRRPRRKDSDRM